MFWGITLKPNEIKIIDETQMVHLTNLCIEFNNKLNPNNAPNCVYIKTTNAKILIATLTPNVSEQVSVDYVFGQGEQITICNEGMYNLHLSGYFVTETAPQSESLQMIESDMNEEVEENENVEVENEEDDENCVKVKFMEMEADDNDDSDNEYIAEDPRDMDDIEDEEEIEEEMKEVEEKEENNEIKEEEKVEEQKEEIKEEVKEEKEEIKEVVTKEKAKKKHADSKPKKISKKKPKHKKGKK